VILLLRALLLQAARWDEQLRWFGERHRVMAPDLKGFGGSDAPEDPAAYSVESYNGEQQHWIRVEDDLQLPINRRVDQLVGRETSRRAEAVRLARRLMGTNPPAG
jgi:pimeloyl-ACP methyl ester carboxylesterase